MPATKREPMTGEELGLKLLASVKQMRAGQGAVVHSPVASVRAAQTLLTVAQRRPGVLRELVE